MGRSCVASERRYSATMADFFDVARVARIASAVSAQRSIRPVSFEVIDPS